MAIGVDIGGTGVRAARVVGDVIVGDVVRETLRGRSLQAVVDAVGGVVAALGEGDVGVGMPGFLREGVVLGSPNFPGWEGVDLAGALSEGLGRRVRVANDANVAALGVWRERGGREDLVLLTLGTGVGGGVVSAGRALEGAGGTGAELGHIHVGGTRVCGCGGVGCLEMWCGTVGLRQAALEHGVQVLDGAEVVAAADRGEAWALTVLAEAAEHLGKGLVTLVNIFNPDVVVFAGGLAAAVRHLGPAETWMRRYAVRPSAERVRLVWGGRAEIWAIVGAAALVA